MESTLWGLLAAPFTDPLSRTWWGALVPTVLVAAAYHARRSAAGGLRGRLSLVLRHPSTRLDLQLLLGRQLLALLRGSAGLGMAWLLATHGVRRLDSLVGRPESAVLDAVPDGVLALAYTLALFVAWDASRFLLHLAMHRVPALWELHQVHHSAALLTPLTFHRIHPLESLLYQLRGALVTGAVTMAFFWAFRGRAQPLELLGVPALGLLLNSLTGNLRHSGVWLRFPAVAEGWLLSPAAHQLHHSADPAHHDRNFGTWLAVWDRAAGTHTVPPAAAPAVYGIPAAGRNHGDDLLSAWLGPVRALLLRARRLLPGGLAALALVGLGGAAQAAEEAPATEGEDDVGIEIIVKDRLGAPRVAGSAQVVEEEALERFEYNDIERILSTQVAGVSTRSEDGFGLRPNIGIRGANSDRSAKVTLMEDGVLLAPAPYAAPAAYYFPMSTRMVGVEVFKGPAATRHGPQTVGGAVNLLTRGTPSAPLGRLDVAVGSFGSLKAHGYAGTGGDRGGVVVEGVHLQSQGFKELDTGGPTGFGRSEFMAKGQLRLGTGQSLDLKLGYARERSHETYLGLTSGDAAATPYRRYAASALGLMAWQRTQAELGWSAKLSPRVRMRTVAYHHFLSRQWRKFNHFGAPIDAHALMQEDPQDGQGAVLLAVMRGEEDSNSTDQQLWIGTNDRRYHATGLQSDLRWTVVKDRIESVFETGLRLHGDDVVRLHTEDPFDMRSGQLARAEGDRVTTTHSDATARALAVHAHEDLGIGRVHLLPGGRVEVVQTALVDLDASGRPQGSPTPITRTTVLPGAGALVEVAEWVDLFAGSYRGFSPVAPGQPEDIQPEISWNSELGARAVGTGGNLEVVGFFNQYQNIVGACTLSGGCDGAQLDTQFNGGEARVLGLETLGGTTVMLPGAFSLPLSFTYTFTQAQFQTTFDSDFPQYGEVRRGDYLPYLPQHQGSAQLALAHPRFDLGLGMSARSGMLDRAGIYPARDTDIPALVLLDASARVWATDWLQVYATGSNLTGETATTSWRPLGARPTAPRQFMVGIKVGNDLAPAPAG